MKRVIIAFADISKEVFTNLKNKTPNVIDHLLKYFMYPEHSARNHWAQEIASGIDRVPKLKRTKKYPTHSDIMKCTWNVWEDTIVDSYEAIQEEYGLSDIPYSSNLYSAIHDYFVWLANNLSFKGRFNKQDCYKVLDQLYNEYIR